MAQGLRLYCISVCSGPGSTSLISTGFYHYFNISKWIVFYFFKCGVPGPRDGQGLCGFSEVAGGFRWRPRLCRPVWGSPPRPREPAAWTAPRLNVVGIHQSSCMGLCRDMQSGPGGAWCRGCPGNLGFVHRLQTEWSSAAPGRVQESLGAEGTCRSQSGSQVWAWRGCFSSRFQLNPQVCAELSASSAPTTDPLFCCLCHEFLLLC